MRLLILGASGLVGKCLMEVLRDKHEVYGTYYSNGESYRGCNDMFKLDCSDTEQIKRILEITKPQIICSTLRGDFEEQLVLHRQLAQYLQPLPEGRMIYMSTLNVYDGTVTEPHDETHPVDAASEYGKFKVACESLLQNLLGDRVALLRVPFIWGKDSTRLRQMIACVANGEAIPLYQKLYTNHTTDKQIAAYIEWIIAEDRRGIFHIGSTDIVTYETFIQQLLEKICDNMPIWQLEPSDTPCYQACVTSREDVPHVLELTAQQIITTLVSEFKQK